MDQPMKKGLIFLDIDGVLSTASSRYDSPDQLDLDCIIAFRDLMSKANADIILTSDWRYFPSAVTKLKDCFEYNKIPLWIEALPDGVIRHEGIGDSILKHNPAHVLVLDDEDFSANPSSLWLSRFYFRTTLKDGLKLKHVDVCLDILYQTFTQ